jgi:S-DNA-T family DNA segregation ATPase FtsK/SpoIIIE
MQCARKGCYVYVADFKGGVDFPGAWRDRCHMVTDKASLLHILSDIVRELEKRKERFSRAECNKLHDYNKKTGSLCGRLIVACDEVAELLDKTGLDKEGKELVTKIEGYLSTIARQGRAFGINLILATQRPDATILAGQIRNNMDYRVCGRADNVLSQIILDSTAASDQIPKDAQGRFINHEGTVFQGYLFDEQAELAKRGGVYEHPTDHRY